MLQHFLDRVIKDNEFEGKIRLRKLKYFADYNVVGEEDFGEAYYDPKEEGFKSDFIILDFDNLTMSKEVVYIPNKEFYDALSGLCKEHLKIEPQDKEIIDSCLNRIKKNLNII